MFATMQEAYRKDVERAFGVLQARFNIIRTAARLWDTGDLRNIMLTCIILHNMIVEDERETDLSNVSIANVAVESVVEDQTISELGQSDSQKFEVLRRWHAQVRDREAHRNLRDDLIEHIWICYGQNRLEVLN
jgi:hypothetical protein